MYIVNDEGTFFCSRCAAYTASKWDTDAGRQSLEWTKYKFFAIIQIEADPVGIGQKYIEQRRCVCQIGNGARFIANQSA
ncbi:hypothetical protein D3C73_1310210 [compost metagenome]